MMKLLAVVFFLPCLSFASAPRLTSWTKAEIKPFVKKEGKVSDRKVANGSEDLAIYHQLVKNVNSVKSTNELATLLTKSKTKNISDRDSSALFLSAHLGALSSLRGMLWRIKPLFEKSGNKFAHSMAVSFLKNTASFSAIINPTEQSGVFLDYLSAPYINTDGTLAEKISTEIELQNWLQTSLRIEILNLIAKLETIPENAQITWNQQVVYGQKAFADEDSRLIHFGYDEVQALISSYEVTVAQIDMFCAYNQKGSLALFQDTGKLYGFDGFLFDKIDGVTGIETANVINSAKYSNLWTLNTEVGPHAMKEAYTLLESAIGRAEQAWTNLGDRSNSKMALSPIWHQASKEGVAATFMSTRRVLKGEAIRSNVTGEIVRFNTYKFFNDPPQDLKKFYPIAFNTNKTKAITLNVNGKNKEIPYRDFTHGSPQAWNVAAYQKYFDVKSNADIKTSLRVINHSMGGMIAQ